MDCKYCYYLNVCPYGRWLVYNGEFMNFYERQHEIPPPTGVFPLDGYGPLEEPIIQPKKKITTPKGPIQTPYGPLTLPPGFLEPLNES